MRFISRPSTRAIACTVTLLLLAPSFLVRGANAASSQQAPTATSGLPAPPAAGTTSPSSFKNVGSANPSTPVLVSVDIPLRNIPALTSLVKEVSDPSSADFRHFLTYGQANQTFLPTAAEYQSVADYLTSKGFTIVTSELNSAIVISGTAGQVSEYLGQKVDMFTNGTYSYYQTVGASTLSGAYSYGSNSTGLLMRPDYTTSVSAASGFIPGQNVTFTEGAQDLKLLQTVYNSTGLLAKGINGKGYTIGLLDFYGNPTVSSDLAAFDATYGFPAPPSFSVDPIGPYNPNLGLPFGWDGEIDLDVQASHAMAPGANIIVYAGNGALPLSTAVAAVVQSGKANVVSQSFGIPEWEYYEAGPLPYLFNLIFSDDYYMLGSAMGMSFLSSSGDGGGGGFSAGPLGGVQYPASSPYVTTLGGTATYISTTASGGLSFNQTAWSSIGFQPYFINEGGGGGGVSILEPTPWYQSSLQVPASFPAGRMVPDLALDSSGNPGAFIIYQGSPIPIGGTSEASPLFAGLLTLIMGTDKGALGLVNPAIYQIAGNPSTYTKAFAPITFGYTIPWVAKFGYNLATGWGAPNLGELARLYGSAAAASSLSVQVLIGDLGQGTGNNYSDFVNGDKMPVTASISTPAGGAVSTGSFTVSIQTLGGKTTPVPLSYNASRAAWTATVKVGNESGIAYVNVAGTSGSLSGSGLAESYVGYLANFVQPLTPYPWTFLTGLEVAVSVTDLFGNVPPFAKEPVDFMSYSIPTNTYKLEGAAALNYSAGPGSYLATLVANLPSGPMALVTTGAVVGYLPFVSGISLLGSDIYPEVVAQPGSIAPGQSLTIVASMTAPENIYLDTSAATGETIGSTIAEGANVTASLVSPSGVTLASSRLIEQPCAQALRVCGAALNLINGYLTIPAKAPPGLYTVLLSAAYNDETTGFVYTGTYWGQVYVAAGTTEPQISIGPSTLFEGENATINANITYPDGKPVTKGVYTALVYPESSQGSYSTIMHMTYSAFGLIPLAFDPATGLWTGSTTMPSPSISSSNINPNAEYYGGPYDVYVSGISADGFPTDSSLTAEQPFFVQPYVYIANSVMNPPQQTSRMALSNVTISAGSTPLTLQNDYFLGSDSVSGTDVTITSSMINGTLDLGGGSVTLSGVIGGGVEATNTVVVLEHSTLSSAAMGKGSTLVFDSASSFGRVTPALPVVTISSPASNQTYKGNINATVSIQGSGVTSLTFFLDGKRLPSVAGSSSPSQTLSYLLNASSLPDGSHTLTVVAVQSDLLSTSASVSFATDNSLAAVKSQLATANSQIATANGQITTATSEISSLQSNLNSANNTISNLSYVAYLAVAVAVVALILGAYASRRKTEY